MLLMPVAFAVVSLGVLFYGSGHHIELTARVLAGAALGVVFLRMAMSFRENASMLTVSRSEALTDALTGLGNRRLLNRDLDALCRGGHSLAGVLALFDLDGFKHYNDTFGHPAGDALLARLGANLQDSVIDRGRAYRMGGDEFCVLLQTPTGGVGDAVQRAVAALIEIGDGFAIRSSYGVAQIPAEAADPEAALRLADQRMYDCKGGARTSAKRQSRDVLTQALREQAPELGDHTQGVGNWPRRSPENSGSTTVRPSWSAIPQSFTTSARWRSRVPSSKRRSPSMRTSGRSCAVTPSSASGSSAQRRRLPTSRSLFAPPTSAGTPAAISTGWPAPASRSPRVSWRYATPLTP
jgi:diguanylate cyclase (GGDEF)-like protein